jgi:uncharacterized protein
MIALDTNFLVYAHRSDNPFHLIARTAIERLVQGLLPWGVPVVCVHEFLAVVTNPKIFKQPTPRATAFAQIEALLTQSGARLLIPADRHLAVLRQLAESGQTMGAQFHDARIAAICLENGITTLWTADRDFSTYPQLMCQSPKDLVAAP